MTEFKIVKAVKPEFVHELEVTISSTRNFFTLEMRISNTLSLWEKSHPERFEESLVICED